MTTEKDSTNNLTLLLVFILGYLFCRSFPNILDNICNMSNTNNLITENFGIGSENKKQCGR